MFWTVVACLHVAVSSYYLNHEIKVVSGHKKLSYVKRFAYLNPLVAPVLAFSVAVGVGLLLGMHICFIIRNETTIESGEFLLRGSNPFKLSRRENIE